MRRTAWILVLALVIATAAWLAWRGTRTERPSPRATQNALSSARDTPPNTQPDEMLAPALESPTISSADARHDAAATLDVRVENAAHEPVAAASLRWVPLGAALDASNPGQDVDFVALDRRSSFATTTADGRGTLSRIQSDPTDVGSVLWVTHPHYIATSVVLPGASEPRVPALVTLERTSRLTARVVEGDARPAVGASVIQRVDANDASAASDALHAMALRALHREVTTNADGAAELHPFPGRNFAEAHSGDFASKPWIGTAPAEVRLELAPTFIVEGRVHLDASTAVPPDLFVRCASQRGTDLAPLARSSVRDDGTWGPLELPVLAADAYVFLLEGGAFAQERVSILPPARGEIVTVDFRPTPGLALRVRVVGPADEPLEGALVSANWNRDGGWRKLEHTTDAAGIAHFAGCEPSWVWIRVRCKRYAPALLQPIELAADRAEPILVKLEAAGRLRGVCTHAGEPVSDFRVRLWRDDVGNDLKVDVRGSSDGSFEIDEAFLGSVSVMAVSQEFPQSETVSVVVTPDEVAKVELELRAPIDGRGRVVDGITNEPIAGASVEVFTVANQFKLEPWGLPRRSDSTGAFEISGLVVGENTLEVGAPNYATCQVRPLAATQETLDLGTIALFRRVSLTVELVHDSKVDCTEYQADLEGTTYYGMQPFSGDGLVRYEGIDPATYTLRVAHIPTGTTHIESFHVRAGQDMHVEVPLHTRSLFVRVIPRAGERLPEGAWLGVVFLTGTQDRKVRQFHHLPADGRVQLLHVEGDEVVLQVDDANDVPLAVRRVSLSETEPMEVELNLDDSACRLRFVTRERAPIAGAQLAFTLESGAAGWIHTGFTDANGEFLVRGFPATSVMVGAFERRHGVASSHKVDLSNCTATPIEIILDPRERLTAKLVERDRPAAGVAVIATDRAGAAFGLGPAFSDPLGLVEWPSVSEGDYSIEIHHPGYWPDKHAITIRSGSGAHVLQVRRLGGVDLVAKDALGNPAAEVRVEFRSVERGELASEWIAGGLVANPPQGLMTDGEGRLSIRGLPNGEFLWSAISEEGITSEGSVVVPPLAIALVEIRVP